MISIKLECVISYCSSDQAGSLSLSSLNWRLISSIKMILLFLNRNVDKRVKIADLKQFSSVNKSSPKKIISSLDFLCGFHFCYGSEIKKKYIQHEGD